MKKFLKMSLAVIGAMSILPAVQALPSTAGLYLEDTSGGLTVFQAVDSTGVASFAGGVGKWIVSVSTGQTIAGGGAPDISLNVSLAQAGAGAGNLLVYYSDGSFGPTAGTVAITSGGSALNGASVTTSTGYDPANTLFNIATPLSDGSSLNANNYSLTIEDSISPVSGKNSVNSLSTEIAVSSVPDSGMTLALLGLALTGVEALRRTLS